METIINSGKKTRIVTVPEYAAMKGVNVDKVQSWAKQNRITTLRRHGKLVVDIEASEAVKEAKETRVGENQVSSPEVILQKLLVRAETSARKSDISRRKWQLLSFVSLMLFAAGLYTAVWVNMEMGALTREQGRLRTDKNVLTEQTHSANTKIREVSRQIDVLRDRNSQLAVENANIRIQNSSLTSKLESFNQSTGNREPKYAEDKPRKLEKKLHQTKRTPQEQSRLNAIQKGDYPEDMTKKELIAALGEPDRVYKGQLYEQLLYFDRSPDRFWFKSGPFLDAATE